jgi:hypothetical protein
MLDRVAGQAGLLDQVPRQPMIHFRLVQHIAVIVAGQIGHDLRGQLAQRLPSLFRIP